MAEEVTLKISAEDLASIVLKKAADQQKKSFTDIGKSIFYTLGAFDQVIGKVKQLSEFAKKGAFALEMEQQFDALARSFGVNSQKFVARPLPIRYASR